jgi:tRNA pseudouridine38-40 synthase
VQGHVEETARRVLKQPLELVGASRTDQGVHAEGQVAHVEVDHCPVPLNRLARALNSRLPTDIEVRKVEPVGDDFDARRGACYKWYRYRVWNARKRPIADWGRAWHVWRRLEDDRIRDGAARFVGTQDFAALQSSTDQPRESTVRTIYRLDVMRHYGQLIFDVMGDGFLYRMVRNIVGMLIEVGRGKEEPAWINEQLAKGASAREGGNMLSAPPHGLTLMEISYQPHPAESVSGEEDRVR